MSDPDPKAQGDIPGLEPDPPAAPRPQPEVPVREAPPASPKADLGPPGLDAAHLLKTAFAILRSPLHGIETHRSPHRNQRLIEGVAYCVAVLAVFVLLHIWRGSSGGVSWWRFLIGGLAFIGAGILAGAMLRRFVGKVEDVDFSDDALMLGGALLFLGAGIVLRAVLLAFHVNFLDAVGESVNLAGVLLAAFTHAGAMVRVGRVREEAAVLLTMGTLSLAQLGGGLFGFRVIGF